MNAPRILVAGASGVLGLEILKLLSSQDYEVYALIRDPRQEATVAPYCRGIRGADVTDRLSLQGVCEGVDIVVSAIGKSVSLFTNSPDTFQDTDYQGNRNLLEEAQAAGVTRFVYVSIFGSETSPRLRVGWAHELFTQQLMQSGMSHTVIKPVGMFSGLHDLIIMGQWGLIAIPGDGTPLTNPIDQRDLAEVCVQYLLDGPSVVAAGGPETHTRQESATMVCQATECQRVLNLPLWLVKSGLRVVRLFSQNLYDKMRYFTYITTHDMIAPTYGHRTFEAYIEEVAGEIEVV